MKFVHWIAIISPILIGMLLFLFRFETNSEQLITLFLPLLWGILFSIGGGIVLLKRKYFNCETISGIRAADITKYIIHLSIIILFESLFFVFLCLLYPLRNIFLSFSYVKDNFLILASIYDSLLMALIILPCFWSLLIGAWVVFIESNDSFEKK